MNKVLVDNSALVALANTRDNLSQQAERVHRELIASNYLFVTTSHIITELINYMSHRDKKPQVQVLIDGIKQANTWEVIFVNESLYNAGYELCMKMQDKDWSLTDCISILVAKQQKITEVFTHDHHFEQAGFEILIK